MKKQLVVNADDFGLRHSINSGIEDAIKCGIVRSVSFVVNTDEFDDSVKIIKNCKNVGIGVHLNITDGKPVSGISGLDFLLNKNNAFTGSHIKALSRIFFHQNRLLSVKTEFKEQIKKLQDTGLKISHIDSHGHVHMFPCLFDIVTELAEEFKIKFIRIPKENLYSDAYFFRWKSLILSRFSNSALLKIKQKTLRCADNFSGITGVGNLTKEKLAGLLQKIDYGLTEIVVHPGMGQEELQAVTNREIMEQIKNNNIELVNFSQILID